MFSKKDIALPVPCKYWAVKKQKCGKWKVSVTPGNRWLGKLYRLDTLWVSAIDDSDSNVRFEGRTTNKLAVKFINSKGTRNLFNKKGGNLNVDEIFNQGFDEDGAPYAEDKDKNFRITFQPWQKSYSKTYDKEKHAQSKFTFECFKDDELNDFPSQMCGNETKPDLLEMSKMDPFLMKGGKSDLNERIYLYYHLFMNEDVTQMDGRCIDAVNILNDNCTSFDERLDALKHCEQIIAGGRHTECVTKYSCDPMDIFNACLRWGCTGDKPWDKKNTGPCEETGAGIDLCPPFSSVYADLTGVMRDANCYKDFLPLKTED